MARARPNIRELPGNFMTVSQAARDFKVGRSTIEYWIRQNQLPGTRRVGEGPGQVILVLRSEVAARVTRLRLRKDPDLTLHS